MRVSTRICGTLPTGVPGPPTTPCRPRPGHPPQTTHIEDSARDGAGPRRPHPLRPRHRPARGGPRVRTTLVRTRCRTAYAVHTIQRQPRGRRPHHTAHTTPPSRLTPPRVPRNRRPFCAHHGCDAHPHPHGRPASPSPMPTLP
ncbi:hypothetical protein BC628DRAFT_1078907, partial [Trametes gibbosa]